MRLTISLVLLLVITFQPSSSSPGDPEISREELQVQSLISAYQSDALSAAAFLDAAAALRNSGTGYTSSTRMLQSSAPTPAPVVEVKDAMQGLVNLTIVRSITTAACSRCSISSILLNASNSPAPNCCLR